MNFSTILLLFLFIGATYLGSAQVDTSFTSYDIQKDSLTLTDSLRAKLDSISPSSKTKNQYPTKVYEPIDSTTVLWTTLGSRNHLKPYGDTSIVNLDNYSPAWEVNNPYLTLGNLGSSSTPFKYVIPSGINIRHGFNNYDLYNKSIEDISLYKIYRPINDLYFTPLNGQANFLVKARFARNFSDDINLYIDYDRVNQEGFYLSQATKSTQISFTVDISRKKYRSIWSFLANNNNEEYNGGIDATVAEFITPLNRVRSRITVHLTEATGRNAENTFITYNQYALNQDLDNETGINLEYNAWHSLGKIRYSDNEVSTDSISYLSFWVDKDGLRFYQTKRTIGNQVFLDFRKSNVHHLKFGLEYAFHRINYTPIIDNLHAMQLKAELSSEYKGLGVNAFSDLGLVGLAGDFNLGGSIRWNQKLFGLDGSLRFFRYSPSLKEEKLYINEIEIWNQQLTKPFGSEISAHLSIPSIRLELDANQIIENNAIYFDSSGVVQQLDDVLSVTSFSLGNTLSLGPLHLENNLLIQLFSGSKIALPEFYSNHRIYLLSKIFDNKLESQIGGEFTYIDDHRSRRFIPLTGSFGHTENEFTEGFPVLNAFINFKIEGFKVFLKYENILDWAIDRPYYQIANYPQFDVRFRMGIKWLLYN